MLTTSRRRRGNDAADNGKGRRNRDYPQNLRQGRGAPASGGAGICGGQRCDGGQRDWRKSDRAGEGQPHCAGQNDGNPHYDLRIKRRRAR